MLGVTLRGSRLSIQITRAYCLPDIISWARSRSRAVSRIFGIAKRTFVLPSTPELRSHLRPRRGRGRPPSPPQPRRRPQPANELKGIWAADLFVVQTIGFRTLYVFFFIAHDRREVMHFNVTASPAAAWVWQQLVEATPWGSQPKHLIHDRDAVYGRKFGARLANLGIRSVQTPFRAPRANSIAERLVRSIRADCLDHIIVINERHLHAVLNEFMRYYNADRPHRSLDLQAPRPREPTGGGRVVSRPVLGGLHHVYARAA